MAQEKPSRMVEWLLLFRTQAPVVRQHLADWWAECREEPRLIWATPAVRYATYLVGGLIAIQLVLMSVSMIAPPPPPAARPQATTADFHVVCADPDCDHHFVIHRKFGFDSFPIECPQCHGETGVQARRCNSPDCQGRWVAPVREDGGLRCPRCRALFE